jgi:hypothetical protein
MLFIKIMKINRLVLKRVLGLTSSVRLNKGLIKLTPLVGRVIGSLQRPEGLKSKIVQWLYVV